MSGPLDFNTILQRYAREKAQRNADGGATPPAPDATPADEPSSEPTITDQPEQKDNGNGQASD